MTTKQAISILKKHNEWRRGNDFKKMQDPKKVVIAIDIVIEQIEVRDEMVRQAYNKGFKNRPM